MGDFLQENWWVLVGGIFTAGTILATIRHNLKTIGEKIDSQTRHMDERFDELNQKDREHDKTLADHDKRLVKVETTQAHQGGWMKEIRDTVRDIHQNIMGGKQ